MTTGNKRRNQLTEASATVNASFGQAISASLSRLQEERGGKNLAECFDGRDGESVAKSTISRWISDPQRFPAIFLAVLVEIDPAFRAYVFQHLAERMTEPAEIVRALSPKAAEEYRRVLDERFRRAVYGPGGAGEHYA